MRGEIKFRPRKPGKVPKWCKRCSGRHAGGVTKCDLVPVYAPFGIQPLARRDVAELAEEFNEDRAER